MSHSHTFVPASSEPNSLGGSPLDRCVGCDRTRGEVELDRPRPLERVEVAKEEIARAGFPWCRALLFQALAGAAHVSNEETGESVLREVLDEAGFEPEEIVRLVDHMRMTGWLAQDCPPASDQE